MLCFNACLPFLASVWSNDKTTEGRSRDREAVVKLLEIISSEHHQKLLKDIKKRKTAWELIASEMLAAGIFLGSEGKAAQKCDQKYRNLKRQYKSYIHRVSVTGREHKRPEYYDDLHSFFSSQNNSLLSDVPQLAETDSVVPPERLSAASVPSEQGTNHRDFVSSASVTRTAELNLLRDIKLQQQANHAEIMSTLLEFVENIKQRHIEEQEFEVRRFEEMKKMHREQMEVQRALIVALSKSSESKNTSTDTVDSSN